MTNPYNPFQSNGQAYDKDGLPIPPRPHNASPNNAFAPQPQPQQPLPQQFVMPPQNYQVVQTAPKQMIAAALLAFFLGGFGAHNFYLGNTGRGIVQLSALILGWLTAIIVVGFVILGALSLWVFVEFVLILAGSSPYDRDSRGIPLVR